MDLLNHPGRSLFAHIRRQKDFVKVDGFTATAYKALSLTSPDCDIHNLIPEPPLPYDTWDVAKDPWVVEMASGNAPEE